MLDIATVTTALSGIKSATDIAKFLSGANTSLDKAETKLKIAELISALADAKIAIADINEIILEKDQKIGELEKALALKINIKYVAPYYWLGEDEKKEGPFCQHCYDKDLKLVRLIEKKTTGGSFHCKICSSWYGECSSW